ncbi:Uma2 family endonuclease [Candidatus Protofrankia californiensis]|uniref:Uma2 family endonuclease n=1 Tax=Candidatus Protofrankia californiensis TaxID=1839754 RepID=UPI0010416C4B|nr:Uma2 family endonuclease [Candidatus Protofrankia californiensis]
MPSPGSAARSHRPTLMLPAPPLTVTDLDELALDPRFELIDGMFVIRPWPTPLETRVTKRLVRLLVEATPSDMRVHTRDVSVRIEPRSEVVPDIIVAAAGDDDRPQRITSLPLLIVEVAEVGNRRYDRTLKFDLYRDHGVPSCWLVDPDGPRIDAYRLVDGAYVPAGSATGDEELTVTSPVACTIVPASLVDPPRPG